MKIATFNINDVNKRLPNLLAWLASAEPDGARAQAGASDHAPAWLRLDDGEAGVPKARR